MQRVVLAGGALGEGLRLVQQGVEFIVVQGHWAFLE